jgi:CelD/BcsL family acetyltransferase involved in cellulose biosynthesis
MRVEICRPRDLGRPETDLWHQYQSQNCRLEDPFLAPEFAVCLDRARSDVRVAVAYDGGKAVAFLPYSTVGRRLARPVAPGLCDVQAVIHDPDHALDLAELVTHAGLIGWSFDHLVSFQAPLRQPVSRNCSWVVDLTGGSASFLEQANNTRPRNASEWRRKMRRLERQYGSVEFLFDTGAEGSFGRMFELKRAQYRRNGWRDVLALPWASTMLRDLAATRTEALTGVLSALVAGDEIISVEFGIRSASVYASWIHAYDVRFGSHSPGSLLWYRLFPQLADAGVRYVDLGKGLTEAKRRFSTGSIEIAEGFVAREGAVGSCAATLAGVANFGRRTAPGVEVRARRAVETVRRRRYERVDACP